MNNLNWPQDNSPDSMCACAHILRVHTFNFYQDMQDVRSLTGPVMMCPISPAYTEWKCADCNCEEFRVDNLMYLEKKLNEKESS